VAFVVVVVVVVRGSVEVVVGGSVEVEVTGSIVVSHAVTFLQIVKPVWFLYESHSPKALHFPFATVYTA
jgi:hypothetical protein